MPRPRILLGGAPEDSGAFSTLEQLNALLAVLRQHNVTSIDTAALYPSASSGRSESPLGEARAAGLLTDFAIDTKIRLWENKQDDDHAPISILYCHVFDPTTPPQETTSTLAELHRSGDAFKTLGISNFTASQAESFISSCKAISCPKPMILEGLYNALSPNAKISLAHLPDTLSLISTTLRRHGMSCVTWSLPAGGFLTGNCTQGNKDMGFDTSNGKSHKFMYDKPSMHDAVKMLAWECENGEGTVKGVDEGDATITPLGEASLRWLYYHSALNEYDGMILRVHSVGMIVANGKAIGRGPLPEGLVVAFDTVRDMVKKDAPIF
ncbi:Aldo/keto reductase [Viridothelium virens]|uniref:Aldo/keto reductase n=1 Tax=Viridothelium virens TaxID=1048519 RepID=A0A6A6HBM2_VIRVR|nr:Aldo/keto reductase [Viridothelium virens]